MANFDSSGASTELVSYNASGATLAGIETAGGDITANASLRFAGKGAGVYGNVRGQYKTVFDMVANVDIGTRNITLTSSNTVCPEFDCGTNATYLDFSGTLKYGENHE